MAEALRAAKIAEKRGTAAQPRTAYPPVAMSGAGRGKVTVAAYAHQWLPAAELAAETRKVYGQCPSGGASSRSSAARALSTVTFRDVRD
jgi:hypothetical protein